MTTTSTGSTYTIKEVAALTGLPASTLRYYEAIGVIPSISRGSSSGHRVYDDGDLDMLMGIACLAATGMGVADMQQYVANAKLGPDAASGQIALLDAQQKHLEREAEQLVLRREYVAKKIAYWNAVAAGDAEGANCSSQEALALARALRRNP